MKKREQIQEELTQVQRSADGTLKPEDVLEWAKNHKGSAIYAHLKKQGAFDSKKALREYGIHCCRMLITSIRVYIPDGAGKVHKIRAYQSLATDRIKGGGYRETMDVIHEPELLDELKRTFLAEIDTLKRRYQKLQAIEPYARFFQTIEEIEEATEEVAQAS